MTLDLRDLASKMPGVTDEIRSAFAQAAAVCFEIQKHASGVSLFVTGQGAGSYPTLWPSVTPEMRASWADLQEATECGATSVAIALVDKVLKKTIVQRARKGTGCDYWLGGSSVSDSDDMFEDKIRLEVSGILESDNQSVKYRTNQKLRQTNVPNLDFPAIVIVVEFSKPQAQISQR